MSYENGTKVTITHCGYKRSGFVAKQINGQQFLVKLDSPMPFVGYWIKVNRKFAHQVVVVQS